MAAFLAVPDPTSGILRAKGGAGLQIPMGGVNRERGTHFGRASFGGVFKQRVAESERRLLR